MKSRWRTGWFWQRLYHKFVRAPAGYGRPAPQAVFDREYASGAWTHFGELSEQPRQLLLAGLIAQLHATPRVLDLGCGDGRLAQTLQPFSYRRYVGVDLSIEALARARQRTLRACEFVQGDFEVWRPHEQFDVIVFSECIGYARDPGSLVSSFLPSLAPEGCLLVSLYRSGHSSAQWRRAELNLNVVEAIAISNRQRQTWDLKILKPNPSL